MNWSKVALYYLFWSENLFDIWWMYVIRGLMQHPYINIQTWPSLTSHKQTTKLVLVWSQIYITNFKPLLLPEIVQKPGKAKLRTLPKFNYTYIDISKIYPLCFKPKTWVLPNTIYRMECLVSKIQDYYEFWDKRSNLWCK